MVPDYETLMLPVLKILADGETWRTADIVARVGEEFELSDDDMREKIPSGRAKLIQNRVGWACTYLRKAGLIESVGRGYNRISEAGREILVSAPERIDNDYLAQFDSFQEFRERSTVNQNASSNGNDSEETVAVAAAVSGTPEEITGLAPGTAVSRIPERSALRTKVSEIRCQPSPSFIVTSTFGSSTRN